MNNEQWEQKQKEIDDYISSVGCGKCHFQDVWAEENIFGVHCNYHNLEIDETPCNQMPGDVHIFASEIMKLQEKMTLGKMTGSRGDEMLNKFKQIFEKYVR
jgi:hypothetical protein